MSNIIYKTIMFEKRYKHCFRLKHGIRTQGIKMIGQMVVAFREALEVGIIFIIIFSFLKRSERAAHIKYVWVGSAFP